MHGLSVILQRPPGLVLSEHWQTWFRQIADTLLNQYDLWIKEHRHRFTECEIYYCGDGHPDTFTHCDTLQREMGGWYFHRTAGEYRGGSFKGVDLSFGDGKAFAGILLRGLADASDTLVDGPSLLVDYWLRQAGYESVASLDSAISGRRAWEESPVQLQPSSAPRQQILYESARVGLTLKHVKAESERTQYILQTVPLSNRATTY